MKILTFQSKMKMFNKSLGLSVNNLDFFVKNGLFLEILNFSVKQLNVYRAQDRLGTRVKMVLNLFQSKSWGSNQKQKCDIVDQNCFEWIALVPNLFIAFSINLV